MTATSEDTGGDHGGADGTRYAGDKDLLARLSGAVGLSGHEGTVADEVQTALAPLADDVHRDALGNVILRKAASGDAEGAPRVMLAAHMDEIGLMVTDIEDGGFLRVAPVGGIDRRNIVAQEVTVHGRRELPGFMGMKPPHLTTAKERKKTIPLEELFVDVGLSEDEVREVVRTGDLISLDGKFTELAGDRVAGKAMDNRASVAVLFDTLRELADVEHPAEVYAVATVQEEVGLRGAVTSAYGIVPDVGVAIDVGFAQQPGIPDRIEPELGDGPILRQGPNIHPAVLRGLQDTAEDRRIDVQHGVAPGRTGTDAWAIQVTRGGIPTGLVSIPLRYMHSTVEVADMSDIREAARLLSHLLRRATASWVEGLNDDFS